MCAIAGMIGLRYNESTIRTMLQTMARRGPDSNGVAMTGDGCLLHARLAIIDPEGGQQPMKLQWQGQGYTLVYNGELYNAAQLRTELENLGHTFLGHSDTEVLLHAYAQWKEACLEKLNGIYAFAIWQKEKKELFLARDRMGVKPLFYMPHNGGLLFASEIKTILQYPDVEAQLDAEGIGQLLLLGPGRKPGSGIFRGIYELEPGCWGRYARGKLSIHRYWCLQDGEHRETFEETAEHVRWLVQDAILRQMVSDVPVGTFLSGGLDSSLITAICGREYQQQGKMLSTFSLDYQNNDQYFQAGKFQPNSDSSFIPVMCKALEMDHHSTVISTNDLVQALEAATEARDLPGMADVDASLLCFCGEISKHVKVALSGECADEIFGGYPWFRDQQILSAKGFPWSQNVQMRTSFLHPQIRLDGEDYVRSCYESTIAQADILPHNSPEERRTKEMVHLNMRWFMQTLLDRKDRMSMYHSLEVRVPFCDHRIAEYLYRVPWAYKDWNGVEKGLLRRAMHGILPDEILWRKKSPYPKTHDPRYMQLVSNLLGEVLEDTHAPILQIVGREKLEGLLHTEFSEPWYGQLMRVPQTIAYMLQINMWMRKYNVQVTES